jgi:selenide,water dikinase
MLPAMEHPDLIEGHARFSDAGVFRLRPDLALVQTVDFFPPLVDDPRDFGRIAAANSLSDVYAMGGTPVTALNIVGFPSGKLDTSILGEILAGGAEKVLEAGAVIVGGHSVRDTEIKYGLAVTGTVHPDRVVSNAGARPGDLLVLTKPLGMGSVSTAIKKGKASPELIAAALEVMKRLNREPSRLMVELGARGATDITGFGLLGHAYEMAESSRVTLVIDPSRVPCLPGALELAARGMASGGAASNRRFLEPHITWRGEVDPPLKEILLDSETSGGLLIALHPGKADELVRRLRDLGHERAGIVGEVRERGRRALEIVSE